MQKKNAPQKYPKIPGQRTEVSAKPDSHYFFFFFVLSWMSVFGEDEVPEEALAEASDTEATKEDSEESVQWH